MADQEGIPHFSPQTAEFTPFADRPGWETALLYRSPDGKRVAGSFKENGTLRTVAPCDEFIYVIGGHTHIAVQGKGEIDLGPGDACYIEAGSTVEYNHSEDFHDVVVLIGDKEIVY
jgi:uncharacterized cupin superfamily protein